MANKKVNFIFFKVLLNSSDCPEKVIVSSGDKFSFESFLILSTAKPNGILGLP